MATLEADAAYAELVRPGSDLLPRLAEAFGPEVLLPDGGLDRESLARIAFEDPVQRARLDALTHPALRERVERWLGETAAAGASVVALEAAVLFEADLASLCTEIWYVDAPAPLRASRLGHARGWDASRIERLLAAQRHLEAHRGRCDRTVDGAAAEGDLRSRVRDWLGSARAG